MKLKTKYYNKDILIVGFGKTGKSILKFFKNQKVNIFLYDDNVDVIKNKIQSKHFFNEKEKDISDFSTIFVSPGISKNHKLIKKAVNKKIPISSDLELFWEDRLISNANQSILGITGTNGKSTIALMISSVFQTQPLGNFGNTILDNLDKKTKCLVIELSSFQLDYIENFKPNISIISNIKHDHLNYHKTFDNYLKAKINITKNQDKEDFLILNYDDENIKNYFNKKNDIKAEIIKISNKSSFSKGIYYKKNEIYDNFFTNKKYALKENNFLKLKHNQLNYTIAFSALLALGLKANKIIKSLNKFEGLPHRLEFLGKIKKISFYNDSKATNVAATCSAIKSFKKVILIAGGFDKGESFKELNKFSDIIIETYLVGENAYKIKKYINKKLPNKICENLKEALERSYKKSISSGKYYPILFSPASASFDNYKSFEHRGDCFKRLFKNIRKKVA
ncbi:MAG: UDP-N-acetylmuramoyl-L-alanine--D-glutamate ligase [Alphaproteobacteria bacterium TMED194]|nr:MAG: UDP-N-acetylmuramoyl-L-alanine--D-glutamate ligase [Alphaproteobacteria bacterium TMED194]|tara:strand:- start:332 stop:1684 length:1353 start_codon:yes stop_codon:yes gene_type:complete